MEQFRMTKRPMQVALSVVLASCGTSSQTTAQSTTGSDPPFTVTAISTFDNPWAMAFLPESTTAVVTEKPGRIWLVDVKTGRRQELTGAPRVLYGGQGGLLDVVLAPTFRSDNQLYLTYSEPSPNGGSSLA